MSAGITATGTSTGTRTGMGTGTAPGKDAAPAASPATAASPLRLTRTHGGEGMNRRLGGSDKAGARARPRRNGHRLRARDLKLDREVADQAPRGRSSPATTRCASGSSREARLAARLDHPNVVQVFDVGEDKDRPFIVMEHVESAPSRTGWTRRRRSVDRDEALRLLGQLCQGLRPRSREEARPPRHQAAEPAAARIRRLPEDHRFRDRACRRGNHPPDAAGEGGGDRPLHGPGAGGRRPDHRRHRRLRLRGGCERAAARSSLTRAARDHRPLPSRRPRRALQRCERAGRGPGDGGGQRRGRSGPPDQVAGRPHQAAPRRSGDGRLAGADRREAREAARPPRSPLDRGRAAVDCGGCGHGDRHRLGRFGFADQRQAGAPGHSGTSRGAALRRPRDSGEAAAGFPSRRVPAGRGRARRSPSHRATASSSAPARSESAPALWSWDRVRSRSGRWRSRPW